MNEKTSSREFSAPVPTTSNVPSGRTLLQKMAHRLCQGGEIPILQMSRVMEPPEGEMIPVYRHNARYGRYSTSSREQWSLDSGGSTLLSTLMKNDNGMETLLPLLEGMIASDDAYTRISALEWLNEEFRSPSIFSLKKGWNGTRTGPQRTEPPVLRKEEKVLDESVQQLWKTKATVLWKKFGDFLSDGGETGKLFIIESLPEEPEEAERLLALGKRYLETHVRAPKIVATLMIELLNVLPLSAEVRRKYMGQFEWDEEDLQERLEADVREKIVQTVSGGARKESRKQYAPKRAPVKVLSTADASEVHPLSGVMIKCYEKSVEEGFFEPLSQTLRLKAILETTHPVKSPFRDHALMAQIDHKEELSIAECFRLRDAYYDVHLADEVAEQLLERMKSTGEIAAFRDQVSSRPDGTQLLLEIGIDSIAEAKAWQVELFDLLTFFPVPTFRRDELLQQLTNRKRGSLESTDDVPGTAKDVRSITAWYVDSGALRADKESTRRMMEMEFVFSIVRQLDRSQRIDMLLVVMGIEMANTTTREFELHIRRRIPGFGLNSTRLTRREQEQILFELYEGDDHGIFAKASERDSTDAKRLLENIALHVVHEGDEQTKMRVSNLVYRILQHCHWTKRLQLTQDLLKFSRKGATLPEMVVAMLCSLGPVFLKGGQQEGQQSWVPKRFREPLMQVNDNTPLLSKEKILEVVARDIGLHHYLHIGEPIGSASLAQVHYAIMKAGTTVRTEKGEELILTDDSELVGECDGEELTLKAGTMARSSATGQQVTVASGSEGNVQAYITNPCEGALKVLRPGVRNQVNTDLELAGDVIDFVNANNEIFGMRINEGLKKEIQDSLVEQVDLRKEVERRDYYAAAVDVLRPKMATLEMGATMPKIVRPDLTRTTVVHYEYVRGIALTSEEKMAAFGEYMGFNDAAEVRSHIALTLLTVQVGTLVEAKHGQRDPNMGNAMLVPVFTSSAVSVTRAKVHGAITAIRAGQPVKPSDELGINEARQVSLGISLLDFGHIEENPKLYKEQIHHLFWSLITGNVRAMEDLLYEFHIGAHLARGAAGIAEVPPLDVEKLRDDLVGHFEKEFGASVATLLDAAQTESMEKERFKEIITSLSKNHNFGEVFNQLLDIFYSHNVVIPKEIMSILRSHRIGSYMLEWVTSEHLLEFLKKVTPESAVQKFREKVEAAIKKIVPQSIRDLLKGGERNVEKLRTAMESETPGKSWFERIMDGVRDAELNKWFEKLSPAERSCKVVSEEMIREYKAHLRSKTTGRTTDIAPKGDFELGIVQIEQAYKVDVLPAGTIIKFFAPNRRKSLDPTLPEAAVVECTYVLMEPYNMAVRASVEAMRHNGTTLKISPAAKGVTILHSALVYFNGKWVKGPDFIKVHDPDTAMKTNEEDLGRLKGEVPKKIQDYLETLEMRVHGEDQGEEKPGYPERREKIRTIYGDPEEGEEINVEEEILSTTYGDYEEEEINDENDDNW